MPSFSRPFTRRRFLYKVAEAGGAAAVYQTMAAMGLMAMPPAYAGSPELAPGRGQSVIILGAGMAGMTAAYELSAVGYNCRILEARNRPGGRIKTVRAGDKLHEYSNDGSEIVVQTCNFDDEDHLYINIGTARIPNHHRHVLAYCKEFGVELQPLINDNRAAYFHDTKAFDGKPIRNRQAINDSRGYIAELLAKAINQGALDQEIDAFDRERLMGFIRTFGALDENHGYHGSTRSGLARASGLGPYEAEPPVDFAELLKADFWFYQMHFGEAIDDQATMLQPVGGMDMIPKAFAARLGDMIDYEMPVTGIWKTDGGVQVTTADEEINADICICTIPWSVLKNIPNNFSVEKKSAINDMHYAAAGKLGIQAERRFWEEDEGIYGGITWSDLEFGQLWYPTMGFQRQKGILLATYIWGGEPGLRFGDMSFAERKEFALAGVEQIYPNFRNETSSTVSRAWHKVPYSEGGWGSWSEEYMANHAGNLFYPDGQVYFAGEHLSHLQAWMEGAILSAHKTCDQIDTRTRAINA